MMANLYDVKAILATLCNLAESFLTKTVVSIMMKDQDTAILNVLSALSILQIGHDAYNIKSLI